MDTFAIALGLSALAIIAAVLSSRLSAVIRIPAPALFLIVASAASTVFPVLGTVPKQLDEEIVTVALIFILFDGGMHIGWRRFRASAVPIGVLGLAGTAVTAAALALAAHFLLGLEWQLSLLLGAALSPTDPAVVFSVLGKREISGRSGTILEGESGANDPVGIALMISLLAATGSGLDAIGGGLLEFLLQMVVGAAVGLGGGWLLARLLRRIALANEALHSIWTLGAAVLLFAIATVAHGSGFLAVLLAGVLVGDARAPFKREIERFSSGIASLAEIVAFTLLGLSFEANDILRADVLVPGLIIAALLILVVRPVLVGALSLPLRLGWGERGFILWAGLKGAVPILLGIFVLEADVPGAQKLYGIIYVVVLVSVVVQGGLVPTFAKLFRVPMRIIEPEPWAVGLRVNEEPEGFELVNIVEGAPADGVRITDLGLDDDGWVSFVRRQGRLLQVRPSTKLRAGDEVLVQTRDSTRATELFETRRSVG